MFPSPKQHQSCLGPVLRDQESIQPYLSVRGSPEGRTERLHCSQGPGRNGHGCLHFYLAVLPIQGSLLQAIWTQRINLPCPAPFASHPVKFSSKRTLLLYQQPSPTSYAPSQLAGGYLKTSILSQLVSPSRILKLQQSQTLLFPSPKVLISFSTQI